MTQKQHAFVWFELNTEGVDDAVDFYTNVIPWGVQVWDEGEEPYTMFAAGENMVGGAMELPEEVRSQGAPPMWLGYVGTADLEASLKKLEKLGGEKASEIIEIGEEMGRFAVVCDPQGATFAIHESYSDEEGGLPEQNTPGAVSWIELNTDDVDAACDFYTEMFGWELGERMEVGEGIPYQIFGYEGRDCGGIGEIAAEMDVPPNWLFYFTVEDLDDAVERVESSGGRIVNGPMEVPGGDRIAHCTDPHGAMFALHVPSGLDS